MTDYRRFAIYYTPPQGAFADFGAEWLGWDIARGMCPQHALRRGPEKVTAAPRRYGFHATLKPPFRLAQGETLATLGDAVARVSERLAPVRLRGLELARLGGFLGLVPEGRATGLPDLAATIVSDLDDFRAPPSGEELARRRAKGLSAAEEENLVRWGYPYVMGEFRFHMTLTGPLEDSVADAIQVRLVPILATVLPRPIDISEITLVGEDADGYFHEVHRCTLSG